jgi:hypothetical protein
MRSKWKVYGMEILGLPVRYPINLLNPADYEGFSISLNRIIKSDTIKEGQKILDFLLIYT